MRWTPDDLNRYCARRPQGLASTKPAPATTPKRKRASARIEPSELAIHFAVVRHLRHRARPGVFWCHFPAGEIRDAATASKLKAMGTKPGVPDFVLLIGGQLHGLELKRHDGRLSPDQRATIVELEAAGGICHVAYSVDEALTVLIAWGGLHADAGKIHRQPERIMAHDEQASPPPTSRLSACCHWR